MSTAEQNMPLTNKRVFAINTTLCMLIGDQGIKLQWKLLPFLWYFRLNVSHNVYGKLYWKFDRF